MDSMFFLLFIIFCPFIFLGLLITVVVFVVKLSKKLDDFKKIIESKNS